jgi:putative ABC transport system permease protein
MLIRTLEQLSQDVRNGIRALRRGRGTTATAVLTLALGIGANAAIFSVAYAWLLREWQVREPARLVFVRARGADGERIDDFAWQTVDQLRLSTRTLTTLSAFDGSTVAVTIDGKSAVVYADFVTGDYFSLLDLQTPLGRPLTRDDDQPGRPPVAVISHAYWRQQFGADPGVIGKTVVLKDLVCTIVGVTSPTYYGRKTAGSAAALMLPMTWHTALGLKDHTAFKLLGRLRPDVTREAARSELDGIYQRILTRERASTAVDPTHAPALSRIELQPATRGAMDDYDRFGREVWIL